MNSFFCPQCNASISSSMKKCPKCRTTFSYIEEINDDLYGGTDNMWFRSGCTALMNDGRFGTYHTPANEITEKMRRVGGFCDHNQFRDFLQNNATKIMDAERKKLSGLYNCKPGYGCSESWNN